MSKKQSQPKTLVGLPSIPSLQDLGITPKQPKQTAPKVWDGKKKVAFKSATPSNVRTKRYTPSAPKTYPTMTITPHGEAISRAILEYPVMAVSAPTGTGKTRYIPYLMTTKGYRVRVAIPTTVAVRDAYNFQRKYTDLRVGFAAGREIRYRDTDQLVYATTGHFTQRILGIIKTNSSERSKILSEVKNVLGDILFVDEVHTGTSQLSLLVGLMRYLFVEGTTYYGPRLVFASATFNHGDIKDYFPEFPIYQVEVPAMSIEDIFAQQLTYPLREDLNPTFARIVREELRRWKQSTEKYHGIIFRPGVTEVEETIAFLEKNFKNENSIAFFPAYSHLSPEEIDLIFAPSDKMKIVVGTNIIESSVTIEDTGFVIDDMLEKIAETNISGGNKLTLALISKSTHQQRRGRTGRTISGRCYSVITQQQYEELPPYRLREIDRIPIYDIVLQLIDANLDALSILKITKSKYVTTIRILESFEMIRESPMGKVVTDRGQFISGLSLNIYNAYLVYIGYKRMAEVVNQESDQVEVEKIVLRSALAVACMLEVYGPSFMFIPRKEKDETQVEYQARKDAYIEKYHEQFRGETDIHTFVNIFWYLMTDIYNAKAYDQASRYALVNYVRDWSRTNSMNHKKIKEFLLVLRDTESVIETKLKGNTLIRENVPMSGFSLGFNIPPSEGGYTVLGDIVAGMLYQPYKNGMLIREANGDYVSLDGRTRYKINNATSFNRVVMTKESGPASIIPTQTVEIVGKGGRIVHLAGLYVPEQYYQDQVPPPQVAVPEESVRATLYTPEEAAVISQEASQKMAVFPIVFGDIQGRFAYRPDMVKYAYLQLHLGQRKLLLMMVDFLTKYGHLSRNVVYAGGAPAIYMPLVSQLFPNHEFWSYDPRPSGFGYQETDKLHTFNVFFTDEVANQFTRFNGDLLFVSDIRLGEGDQEQFETGVNEDNVSQERWLRIMNPIASSLKFRLPFFGGENYEYLQGEVTLQSRATVESAETRLLVKRQMTTELYPKTEYNRKDYEQAFVKHNMVNRDWNYYQHDVPLNSVPGLDHCYDCVLEILFWRNYIQKTGYGTVPELMNAATAITGQSLDYPPHGVCPETPMLYKREEVLPESKKLALKRAGYQLNPFWTGPPPSGIPACQEEDWEPL